MAYRYVIDPDVNCAFVEHTREFVRGDGIKAVLEVADDPAFAKGMNFLLDYRAVQMSPAVDFSHFIGRSNQFRQAADRIGECRIAIVTGSLVDFGTARQFATITEGTSVKRNVFASIDVGMAWIGLAANYVIDYDRQRVDC